MIKCKCCLQEKTIENYYSIVYKTSSNVNLGDSIVSRGEETEKINVIEEYCSDCLDVADIKISNNINYKIQNLNKYHKKTTENYIKKVLGLNREDYYTIREAHEIIKSLGLTKLNYKGWKSSMMKSDATKGFYDLIETPLGEIGGNFGYIVLAKKFDQYKEKMLNGKYTILKTVNFDSSKFDELRDRGFLAGDEDNIYLYTDYKNKLAVCRDCGEIKPFSEFRMVGESKRGFTKLHYICRSCEKIKVRQKYINMTAEDKEKHINGVKAWRKKNIDRVRELTRKYDKLPKNRIKKNIRRRLSKFMKLENKNHYRKDIGCTVQELVDHLESQFVDGMSWNNYGSGENGDHRDSWHVDHIIPLSKFEGQYPNHYTNLQPLWAADNLHKSDKLE